MLSRTLSMNSCEHFYRLRNALCVFAYETRNIPGELYCKSSSQSEDDRIFIKSTTRNALEEVWKNPEIIDEYITRNSAELSDEDCEILRSWQMPLNSYFAVLIHKGRMLFFHNDYLFEVTGLMDKLEDLIPTDSLPIYVQTTLLPFEGKVVYDGFFTIHPIQLGEGIRGRLDRDIKDALSNHRLISSGNAFIEIVPEIIRSIDEEDPEAEGEYDVEGTPCHRGVLAGLSPEERDKAIHAELDNSLGKEFEETLLNSLRATSTKGTVCRSLDKLFALDTKKELMKAVHHYRIKVSSSSKKAEIVDALYAFFTNVPEYTENLMAGFPLKADFEAYRKLYEEGGILTIEPEDLSSWKCNLHPIQALCYCFHNKGLKSTKESFTFVIPIEIMAILDTIDFDQLEKEYIIREDVINITSSIVELRGVVKLEDAYDEFSMYCTYSIPLNEYEVIIGISIMSNLAGIVHLSAYDGNTYLMNMNLGVLYTEFNKYLELSDDEFYDVYEDSPFETGFLEGPLAPLDMILDRQKSCPPRHLDGNMLRPQDLCAWMFDRPAVHDVIAFLDANVPDTMNDYYFADGVVEEMVNHVVSGINDDSGLFSSLLDIMECHEYVPAEEDLDQLLKLLMNMCNSLPRWTNNGWSPEELILKKRGRMGFYDKKGNKLKPGRNDLCPCGSGKKYKHCCGKC